MPAGWLLLALSVYLVPMSLGYAWNALGARAVTVPGREYTGRLPDSALTVEWFGTSALFVPFNARLRTYLLAGELPLWNPYQGLGEVFAAQGEGSPYSPLALVRALIPGCWADLVSVAQAALAAGFTAGLLRNLGISQIAAMAGGAAFALSGALALHLPRGNIVEQLSLLPVLLWAAERAVRLPGRASAFVVLAVATALVAVGGFIQIALVELMLSGAFVLVYAVWLSEGTRDRLWRTTRTLGAQAVGLALGAVHLLPVAEAIRVSHNPRGTGQAFVLTPPPNLLAFFAPGVFGGLFQSWLPGSYPDVVDWNNLYGAAGLGIGIVAAAGLAALNPTDGRRALAGWFFGLAGLVLLLRYGASPLVAGVNLLPVLAQQTPKHANGVTVFCFVIAAAIGIDALSRGAALGHGASPSRWARWRVPLVVGLTLAVVASAVATFVGLRGGPSVVGGPLMTVSLALTGTVGLVAAVAVAAAWRWRRLTPQGCAVLLGVLVVAELTIYVPLGNSDLDLVGWRLGLFLVMVVSGLALALGARWLAAGGFALVLVGTGAVVAVPAVGLPARADVDVPPAHLRWLREHAGDEYRAFGIVPNYSSTAQVQDLGTIGPFVPMGYAAFVDALAFEPARARLRGANTLFLSVPTAAGDGIDLKVYAERRALFDWLGVRYLVLDRDQFREGGRTDHLELMQAAPDIRVAYEDPWVTVLESPSAEPKASFAARVQAAPSRAAIVEGLAANPGSVLEPPRVVGTEAGLPEQAVGSDAGPAGHVSVVGYRPNRVELVAETTGPGWVILKDAYAPGWRAEVDGQPEPVREVNAMVRGVAVQAAGRHTVVLTYQPASFLVGVVLSVVALLFLVLLLVPVRYSLETLHRRTALACIGAGVLVLTTADAGAWAFGGRSLLFAPLLSEADAAPRTERLAAASTERAQYVPDAPRGAAPDAVVPERSRIGVGRLALLGSTGRLVRATGTERETEVIGTDGQTVLVDGVGPWDAEASRLLGLPATFQNGRWQLDTSQMRPVWSAGTASSDSASLLLGDLAVQTRAAGVIVQRLDDRSGPFVRVQATRRATDLLLGAPVQLQTSEKSPISLRAELRARTALRFHLGLLGLMLGGDAPRDVRVSQVASGGWDTLTVRTPRLTAASPTAWLVLGVEAVAPGDWFDVREVSLYLGALP